MLDYLNSIGTDSVGVYILIQPEKRHFFTSVEKNKNRNHA